MNRQMRKRRLPYQPFRCLAVLFLAWLMLPVGGCRRAGYLDEKERGNRIVAKAHEMVDLGDYEAATSLFRKALDTYPAMARPHLDLALVLHDRQKDYLRAVYHYNRYLELRPGTEKDVMIRARIRQAERAFVASRVTVNGADGPSAMQLLEENSTLRARLGSLENTVVAQEKELLALREAERRRLRDQVITGGTVVTDAVAVAAVTPITNVAGAVVERPLLLPVPEPPVEPTRPPAPVAPVIPVPAREPVVVAPMVPPVAPIPAREPVAVSPEPSPTVAAAPNAGDEAVDEAADGVDRTYTVQRGDSLSRIAFKVYGDATRWRGIQEANRAVLGDSVNVRVGQLLIIP